MNTFWAAFVGGLSGAMTTQLFNWLRQRDARRKARQRWMER